MEKLSGDFIGYLLIDFDSTFVQIEALDKLAKISLADSPHKQELLSQIENITKLGMEGQINFRESLQRRLQLFASSISAVQQLILVLQDSISTSILPYQDWFQAHSSQIYLISGGFQDYILPVVQRFHILPDHILANKFIFDAHAQIIGFDTQNPLSQPQGKVLAVQSLNLAGPIYIVGDGYTDFQIKESQSGAKFIAYTENITRATVVEKADHQAASWTEVIMYLTKHL